MINPWISIQVGSSILQTAINQSNYTRLTPGMMQIQIIQLNLKEVLTRITFSFLKCKVRFCFMSLYWSILVQKSKFRFCSMSLYLAILVQKSKFRFCSMSLYWTILVQKSKFRFCKFPDFQKQIIIGKFSTKAAGNYWNFYKK